MRCLLILLACLMSPAFGDSVPTDGAQLTPRAQIILHTVMRNQGEVPGGVVDVYLRLDQQPVLEDMKYSILPVPNSSSEPDEEAQTQRYREIKRRIQRLELEGIAPMDDFNTFLKPSQIIRSMNRYQVRLQVDATELQHVLKALLTIHPSVSDIELQLLSNMLLIDEQDVIRLASDSDFPVRCTVHADRINDWAETGTDVQQLGATGALAVFETTHEELPRLRAQAEQHGGTVRLTTAADMEQIRSSYRLSASTTEQKQLAEICPRARIISRSDTQIVLGVTEAERRLIQRHMDN